MVKGKERRVIMYHGHVAGRGRISTSAQGTYMSFRFK
jgi:hypothetical protein